ncbi:snRNA-activating protein complex subunit 3-like [Ischnura elegans]|uniref:snRNA-activating protein complex subunit 3-like n=1 Tax=Ischnura elegans TaxID=197161 RepID=UPI001ED8BCB4|nr:snRNA-activating protein complex subunit 3-like [Ischnura elegans]XP_046401309.1 snRNA-activating protein complex subunit 3-like [Ischnura elegans]
MEQAYSVPDDRFVYEQVDLRDYFSKLCQLLAPYPLTSSKMIKDILLKVLKLEDPEDFDVLASYCALQKYTVPDEPKPIDVDYFMKHPGLYDALPIPPDGERKLKTLELLLKRNDEQEVTSTSKISSCKWVGKGMRVMDLKPWQHFALVARIYHPFKHVYGAKSHRPPKCCQEIMILGHQTLDCVRDKIICANDLNIPGDLSDRINNIPSKKAKDVYPSGLFFIEDRFYIDMRAPGSKNYSVPIKVWAQTRSLKIGSAPSLSMNESAIQDLKIRLGYPYVYQHQGNCEHIILFSDARLLQSADSLSSADYPVLLSVSSQNSKYCMICGHYVARWICQNSNRLPFSICYMCDSCFKSYNYVKGKKVGHFIAYQYADRSTIL